MASPLMKQVLAEIDNRTTICCLDAAGQIRPVRQPFNTLQGDYDVPPFHIHCRSIAIPYVRGAVTDMRKKANSELVKRPKHLRDKRKYQPIPGPTSPVRVPTPAPSVVVPARGPMTPEAAAQAGKDLASRVSVSGPITAKADEKVRDIFRRLGERFPHAATRLRAPMVAATGKPTSWGDYTDGLSRLRINPKLLTTPWKKMQALYEAQVKARHWVTVAPGTDYLYNTIGHEFGHHMHYLLENSVPRTVVGEMWGDIDLQITRAVERNAPGYRSMLSQMTLDEKIAKFGPKIVSGYAGTNRWEFVAECFAEYLSNPNPSQMATVVGRAFEDTFGPNSTARLT